jgi:hypothetical protein
MDIKKLKEDFEHSIKENWLLYITFFLATLFFLVQHKFYLGWDFAAYSMNAKYLFHGGDYFEVYRAPLISILLGFFMVFGPIAHYMYILFVSILFFISTIKLADSLYESYFKNKRIDKITIRFFLYILLLTPFTLRFGLMEGTELLGLSLLQLFLASFLSNKNYGHYLGLAFLTRYNFLLFSIFLFLNRDYKKILKNILLFAIIVTPWFIFNFFRWGNPLTSLVDSYYLNVFARQDITELFKFFSLIYPLNYLLPLFIIGVFVFFRFGLWKNKSAIVLFFVSLLLFWDVYNIPFKIIRYMFNFSLPIAYFSLIGAMFLIEKCYRIKKYLIIILLSLFIFSTISLGFESHMNGLNNRIFKDSANAIEKIGFEECKVLSNYWVPINYYAGNVFYLGKIDESIELNQTILILKGYTTMDDQFDMKDINLYHSIYEEDRFVFLGKEGLTNQTCFKRHGWDYPMIQDPCKIVASKFESIGLENFIKKTCSGVSKA